MENNNTTQSRIQMQKYPAYGWEQIKIIGRSVTWTIDSVDHQGNVEITGEENDDERSLFLSQDELKQVIAFLQKQVK
jgi:hypothetical protein